MSGNRHSGALAVGALVVLGLVGCAPAVTDHPATTHSAAASTPTPTVDPTAGWLTCNDAADGLTFKYPSTWTVLYSCPPTSEHLTGLLSPSATGFATVFSLDVSAGPAHAPQSSVPSKGEDTPFTIDLVQPLTNVGSTKPLYLIAYSDDYVSSDPCAVAMTDTLYTVGQTVPLVNNFVTAQGDRTSGLTFEAILVHPATAAGDREFVAGYPLTDFTQNPSFQDLVTITNSLTFTS